MTVEAGTLTKKLQPVVATLAADMREKLHSSADDAHAWRARFDDAHRAQRVGVAYEDWEDEQLTQAAVGWVVTSVFVRFIEDNALFGPDAVYLSGHTEEKREVARFYEQQLYRAHPEYSYRAYLEACFAELSRFEATARLVDSHAAFHIYAPSDDGAKVIVDFWRTVDPATQSVLSLHDPELSTRYLGDLYENLSEFARKKYALLQTPEFVEEFILDRTLTPALRDRPLEGFKLIDPTCGSGHFLIGAFRRLFDAWCNLEPATDRYVLAERAMTAIHGVDINPFAVAITQFRLVVEYLKARHETHVTPGMRVPFTVLTGDSLLFGGDQAHNESFLHDDVAVTYERFYYPTENSSSLDEVLASEQYDVVVGNPPYIKPKDPSQKKAIGARYGTYCSGSYALIVPFMVKFFLLAKTQRDGSRPGWVGQITSNAFMQRYYGAPLMEKFFPKVELREIIDSSGAYIPGHGTPTVILIGRNVRQSTSRIRAVLGIEGEPGVPESPEQGLVWRSIVEGIDHPGFENRHLSVKDLDASFALSHPWSLEGGAAPEVSKVIDAAQVSILGDLTKEIGRTTHTGLDPVFFLDRYALRTRSLNQSVPLVTGENVRDFRSAPRLGSLFPYDDQGEPIEPGEREHKLYWAYRTLLTRRQDFGQTPAERGLRWFDHTMFFPSRYRRPLGIAYPEVSTHNHFVLDRGGKVFKQTAPVIKLPEGTTEDDHLELLGVLNSSVAAFWIKQNSHDKGNGGYGGGIASDTWERFYQVTGTTMKRFPLPAGTVTERARRLDALAQELDQWEPANLLASQQPSEELLSRAREEYTRIRRLMIAEQEELDWAVYQLYGLTEEDLSLPVGEVAGIALGERAFEIRLAREIANSDGAKETAWFKRHHSTPITQLPTEWEEGYRERVGKRLALMESDRFIDLLERPEYKRRWSSNPWEEKVQAALKDWLLDKLETPALWFRTDGMPRPRTIAELAGQVEGRSDFAGFVDVLRMWHGMRDATTLDMLTSLLKGQAVPYLKEHRYTASGLRKRAAWERTWAQQREEDAGQRSSDNVEVPPTYKVGDMQQEVWPHRGKLDVPKERFIAFPGAASAEDPTLMIGWAGWDYLQQGLACYLLFDERLEEDADAEVLAAILNGLQQVLPWIMQWHNDIDPDLGMKMGDYLTQLLEAGASRCGVAVEDLQNYVPPRGTRRRATKKGK